MDKELFNIIVLVWIATGLVIIPVMLRITAPYGRHTTTSWGPMIDNRLGWILMELKKNAGTNRHYGHFL